MNKKYYFWIAAIVIIAVLVYFLTRTTVAPPQQDEQTAVKCGNKTVFRYRYPSKIFPVLINDYSTNVKLTSGVLDKLIADSSGGSSVSVDVKNSARQLRDTLNQDNIFFENNLKAYFLALNDDPCNDSLRYMYTAYITEMSTKVIQLRQFVAQISSPSSVISSSSSSPSSSSAPPDSNVTNVTKDSVLLTVDTSKKQVNTGAGNINPNNNNQLVVVKDYKKLNLAIDKLQTNYKTSELRINPSIIKAHK